MTSEQSLASDLRLLVSTILGTAVFITSLYKYEHGRFMWTSGGRLHNVGARQTAPGRHSDGLWGAFAAFCDSLFAKRMASNERTSERTKDGLGGPFGLRPLARQARTLEREFIVRRVVRSLVFVFRERRFGKPPLCCDGLVSLSLISSRETAGAAALYDCGSAFLCPECP
ncbi:hypothetical protein HETIRDRAFT_101622 [Heterobasidion irregulare TC 32-1]|uniref:Uncharacterized protein n=1 Tax=Heterobasidion irregulare (strain TC 32-1) TaxID=747525 RepID=W4K400_HETIT|nr:uncharacterized protein HETIRDRAFT_101622 [Heterobasidion irregulare TC 32-1]ETW80469.1 hypothetical protein HETIRDRAFT_101622 [Heterobasidion irregulare TC 32-1]